MHVVCVRFYTTESGERFSWKFCKNDTTEGHHALKKENAQAETIATLNTSRVRSLLYTTESVERFSRKFCENDTTEGHHIFSVVLTVVQNCRPLSEITGPDMFRN